MTTTMWLLATATETTTNETVYTVATNGTDCLFFFPVSVTFSERERLLDNAWMRVQRVCPEDATPAEMIVALGHCSPLRFAILSACKSAGEATKAVGGVIPTSFMDCLDLRNAMLQH